MDEMGHLLHRLLKADRQRADDDGIADVQLFNAGKLKDRLHIVVVKTVARGDQKPERSSLLHRAPECFELERKSVV